MLSEDRKLEKFQFRWVGVISNSPFKQSSVLFILEWAFACIKRSQ